MKTENKKTLRDYLTPEQRACPLQLSIDPGFVHHRKIQAIIGIKGMRFIDDASSRLPADMPDWTKEIRIDHIYKDVLLTFCKALKIRTLQEVYLKERGTLFCSVEELGPAPDFFNSERTKNEWIAPFATEKRVEIHYTTKYVRSDTEKTRLKQGGHQFAIVGQLSHITEELIIVEPLLIGAPWLATDGNTPNFDILWHGYDFFENYIEDFDEFEKCRDIKTPKDSSDMQYISEKVFKECVVKILGDKAEKDWGGETSDYFSSHLHLNGRRVKGAFLFKGPSKYSPMKLTHLGKNNDQILRLAEEPADVLFVQHCHDITPAVRKTLRAFAVQPGNPRRYCLIDGRDSVRLLLAYTLLDEAKKLSKKKTQ